MPVEISILIDYAHEPESLRAFLQTLQNWKKNGYFDILIHVLSCDGLGRDDWKKPIMGSLSYEYTDFTVLTTDNYGKEDDPAAILNLLGQNFLDKDEELKGSCLDNFLQNKTESELKIVTKNTHTNPSLSDTVNCENSNGNSQSEISKKTQDFENSLTNNFGNDILNVENLREAAQFDQIKVKFLLETDRRTALFRALQTSILLAENQNNLDNLTSLENKENRKVKALVFSTGVGSEPFLNQPDGHLAWNEKQVWQELWQKFSRENLAKINKNS